ncbi:hypothetical protein [Photobacterium sp. TY1-4]|uniref:hypothetical protein n=1 Tax=Photobacterium sp. TY1-4 TaxID=2899122 RepID=UPI0021BF882B|nr:hypothetical protein [Photobacterium sp. TY1-4]UXI03286.1 hypothetical protein NH461_22920 [Photobacterium sp. TY1-4]
MKKCPAIVNITFDENSLHGIDKIKELHNLEKYGRIWLTIGHLFTIFGGSSLRSASTGNVKEVLNLVRRDTAKTVVQAAAKQATSEANQTAYAITQANWEYFFTSFDSLSDIKRKEIEELAFQQALQHQKSPKEYVFWKSIYMGCQL